MENLLLEAIIHVKNIRKKKPTVKRIVAHINSLGANNWDESVVEETLCILSTKEIINENYKILATRDTNTLPSDDELLKTPLVSSTDGTIPDSNLLLFQELQFSTSQPVLIIPLLDKLPQPHIVKSFHFRIDNQK